MKKFTIIVIALFSAAAFVSAQPKQRVAVLPSVGDLEPQGLILLTDKVREIATKNLPIGEYNILKLDAITKMIGAEELYRACKEGVCIGDLARKTDANYGARCDVIKFENNLVLKFELYSVNEDAIFETFTDYDVKDFRGMLAVLEARLPATFQKMVYDKALADARDKEREQQKQEAKAQQESKPAPVPEPPKIYTVAADANPPDGGTVSRDPNYHAYYAGTRVTVAASPNAGYTFAGWNGVTAPASNNSNIIITVENNLTLTANFQRIPVPAPQSSPPTVAAVPTPRENAPYAAKQQPKPRKKASPTVVNMRIAGAAAGGIGLIGGLIVNGGIQGAFDEYYAADRYHAKDARENIDGKIALRNVMYTVAGVGLTGFTVMLFF